MSDRCATKHAVQYWYRQDDSLYFSIQLKASINDLYGRDTAIHIEQALNEISYQFQQFKVALGGSGRR
jgi:hypothetical protein